MSPRRDSAWFMALAVVWALVMSQLALRTGGVIVDSFQSIGPVAGAAGPGRLRWPMLGSFLGYDQVWGFHWIGWPLLRSLLLPVLPWHPAFDLALLCVIWAIAAVVVFRLAARQGDRAVGWAAGLVTMAAPGLLVVLPSYRPEIPTALLLVLLLAAWGKSSWRARFSQFVLLVALPLTHPLGLVVPGVWCLVAGYGDWKSGGFREALRHSWPRGLAIGIGVVLFATWYGLQPQALAQFRLNVATQRMLVEGLGAGYLTLFRWGLGGVSTIPLLALLIPAIGWGATMAIRVLTAPGKSPLDPRVLAGTGVIAAFAFNWVARNPNALHLTAILPLAAWLFCDAAGHLRRSRLAWSFWPGLAASLVVFALFPVRQAVLLMQHRGLSYRSEVADILEHLPPARRMLIPVSFWEAAQQQRPLTGIDYRFSTFPNILPRKERTDYETSLLAETRAGDLLVWDPVQDEAGIFNFVTATALKHQLIRPHDNPAEWERLPDASVPVTYSRGQTAFFEIYRRR